MVMNPLDNVRLTNLVVGAGQLRYVVQAGESADQGQLTAQYRVTRYLNKSTGKEMPIIIDRYCPQGHLVFLPLSVAVPDTGCGERGRDRDESGVLGRGLRADRQQLQVRRLRG